LKIVTISSSIPVFAALLAILLSRILRNVIKVDIGDQSLFALILLLVLKWYLNYGVSSGYSKGIKALLSRA
jgi:hypothetical protein